MGPGLGAVFQPGTAGEILGAMITPAVLISASGTLVMSTSNRLGRIVDRVRALLGEAEALPEGGAPDDDLAAEKRRLLFDQIDRQHARIRLLQAALTGLYVAIGLLVGTSLAIGVSAANRWALGWVPIGLGLAGATALLGGAVQLVREVRLAVRSTLSEMDYVKRVVDRKAGRLLVPGAGPGGPPAGGG